MDYENKYKKALEIARKINSGEGVAAPPDWTNYEVIFPELKESDGERIVRCLLNYFNHVRYNGLDLKGTDIDEVIAWLEKQSKKKSADEVLKIRQELYQNGYNDGYKHGYNHGQSNIAIALGKESIEALEHFVRSVGESGYASPYDNRTKLFYKLLNQLKQIVK